MSAKQSRRKRSKQSYKPRPVLENVTSTAAVPEKSVTVAVGETPVEKVAPRPVAVVTNPYVTAELKQIGIIAAIMIAVLVVLSRVL